MKPRYFDSKSDEKEGLDRRGSEYKNPVSEGLLVVNRPAAAFHPA
jgi:hypothetical protein